MLDRLSVWTLQIHLFARGRTSRILALSWNDVSSLTSFRSIRTELQVSTVALDIDKTVKRYVFISWPIQKNPSLAAPMQIANDVHTKIDVHSERGDA